MAEEIERKFLVESDGWKDYVRESVVMRQGYLSNTDACSIRVRVSGDKAYLNIKSATLGVHRTEFEYAIPHSDAEEMLDKMCSSGLIEKTRHYIEYEGKTWELDVFAGDNQGLVLAELELRSGDETFVRPPWIGKEVSDDARYYNVSLVEAPYKMWSSR
jgi:adenylate cyclase